jgi:NADH-quinone oxidoreductase subunit A
MEPSGQLQQYLPVLMLGLLAVGFTAFMLFGSVALGRAARRSQIKDMPYECGIPPSGSGSPRMSVKFYLVAMLFILFDIEVVFLYPWAVVYREMIVENAPLILGGMIPFLALIFVGFVYELKKGGLDWK